MALSSDGNTALIGGWFDNEEVGATWVFVNQPASPMVATEPASGITQTSVTLNPNVGKMITTSVTPAEITALLTTEITLSGKAVRIAAMLKSSVFSFSFKALEAGIAVIDWYEVPPGAHLAKKAEPLLVAAGRLVFGAAGTATIKIKLTSAGKLLLKRSKRLKLTARATFRPIAKEPVVATKTSVLSR